MTRMIHRRIGLASKGLLHSLVQTGRVTDRASAARPGFSLLDLESTGWVADRCRPWPPKQRGVSTRTSSNRLS